LDLLVADKVMDLEWRPLKMYYSPEGWYPKSFRGSPMDHGYPKGFSDDLPAFSSAVGPAWRVVARIKEIGGETLARFKAKWLATEDLCTMTEEEFAHWVALAALEAVGYKEG
jgi:hypothetical protein